MKFQIKRSLFCWNIVNEKNVTVAKIKNKRLFSPAKIIKEPSGNVVYTTDIVTLPLSGDHWNYADSKKYIVYQNERSVATATFSFAKNPARTKIQVLTLRPPQIDEMSIETNFGVWKIKRQKDNSVIITDGSRILGCISAFFSFKRKYLELFSSDDPLFWAGIYVLVDYMMHEDDLIVI